MPSSDDAARLVFGAQAYWGGRSHLIEILPAKTQWGDAHPHPGVILVSSDWFGDGAMEYIVLDGASKTGTTLPAAF